MATPTAPRPAGPRPAPTPRPVGAPKPAAPAPGVKPSRLGALKRERLKEALRFMFYGPPGVGKTSLLADMERALHLDIEGGSTEIETTRYIFRDEPGGHVPRTYEDVLAAIDDLIAHPDHGFATLAIDGFSKLEAMLHNFLCERDKKANIEAYGFGKGYKVALVEWRILLGKLDTLRARGTQIAIAGHSSVKTFKNPEGDDFDRYQPLLNDQAAAELVGWADVVGFVHFEGGSAKLVGDESQKPRARGWSTERRLIELARMAAWDAKCRLSLPAQLELGQANPWRPFAEAKLGAREATADTLAIEIVAEVTRITGTEEDVEFATAAGNKTSRTAIAALIAGGDSAVLARVLAGLKATNPVTGTQE